MRPRSPRTRPRREPRRARSPRSPGRRGFPGPVPCAAAHWPGRAGPHRPGGARAPSPPARASGRRRQGGERDDQRHRASAGDCGSQGSHDQHPQDVTGQQHGAPWIAVGNDSPERANQHVREKPDICRGAHPAGRVGRAVHVSEQRGVVQPVTDLRGGAGPDQRAGARQTARTSRYARLIVSPIAHGRGLPGPGCHGNRCLTTTMADRARWDRRARRRKSSSAARSSASVSMNSSLNIGCMMSLPRQAADLAANVPDQPCDRLSPR